jgi:hypothetical protein
MASFKTNPFSWKVLDDRCQEIFQLKDSHLQEALVGDLTHLLDWVRPLLPIRLPPIDRIQSSLSALDRVRPYSPLPLLSSWFKSGYVS